MFVANQEYYLFEPEEVRTFKFKERGYGKTFFIGPLFLVIKKFLLY